MRPYLGAIVLAIAASSCGGGVTTHTVVGDSGEVPDGADATILSTGDGGRTADADAMAQSIEDSPSTNVLDGFFPDGLCGPSTCPNGCCNGDGFCVDPPTAQLCGGHGSVCTSCGAGICTGDNGCVRMQPTCGPGNCGGCCIGSSSPQNPNSAGCYEGTFSIFCGHNGSTCTACGPDQQCRPLLFDAGGYCESNATCDPSTCTGCCVGNICAQGNQSNACGYGGAACASCNGAVCVAGKCTCGGPVAPPCPDGGTD